MKCKKIRLDLNRCLDGEPVNKQRKDIIEHHVAGCAGCRKYLEEMFAMRSLLAQVKSIEITEVPLSHLMEEFRKNSSRSLVKNSSGEIMANRILSATATLAAAVLIVISFWILTGDRMDPVKHYLLQSMENREALYLSSNDWMLIPR